MIDDVTTHATLMSYSLTVMCHLKKKHKTTPNVQYRIPYRGRGGEESEGNIKLSNLPKRFDTIPDDQRLCCFPTTPKVSDIRLKVDNYQ